MFPFHGKTHRISGQWHNRLKTTCMGLGLARLQIDVGLAEEARKTLAFLQDDCQLLLHAIENPKESVPREPIAEVDVDGSPAKQDSLDWTEELCALNT